MIEEILGDDKVSGIRMRDLTNDARSDLEAAGVFVYIGLVPNTALVQGTPGLDSSGAIPTDSWMRTDRPRPVCRRDGPLRFAGPGCQFRR